MVVDIMSRRRLEFVFTRTERDGVERSCRQRGHVTMYRVLLLFKAVDDAVDSLLFLRHVDIVRQAIDGIVEYCFIRVHGVYVVVHMMALKRR